MLDYPKRVRELAGRFMTRGDARAQQYHTIGDFALPVRPSSTLSEYDAQFVPEALPYFYSTKEQQNMLAAAVLHNMPLLLIGPKGVGKTTLIRQLAAELRQPCIRIQLDGSIDTDSIVGAWTVKASDGVPETVFLEKPLVEALRRGYWVQIDELNAARAEVLLALHSVLDDDRFLVLSEKDGSRVAAHPNCRFFASMNPCGPDYQGTHVLNAATQDRFIVVHMDYPDMEATLSIVGSRVPQLDQTIARAMCEVGQLLRDSRKGRVLSLDLSTRQLIAWADLTLTLGVLPGAGATVLGHASEEDRNAVRELLTAKFADPMAGKCSDAPAMYWWETTHESARPD